MKFFTTIKLSSITGFLVLLGVLAGCSNQPKSNLFVFKTLNYNLNLSNNLIRNEILGLIEEMDNKTKDPLTVQIATPILANAVLFEKETQGMIQYLDSLKEQLKGEAGWTIVDGKGNFREDDIKAVSSLFYEKGKGEELKKRFVNFEKNMLNSIDEKYNYFKNRIHSSLIYADFLIDSNNSFTDVFFGNIPCVAALSVLTKFQNDVRLMEYRFIEFLRSQIPSV